MNIQFRRPARFVLLFMVLMMVTAGFMFVLSSPVRSEEGRPASLQSVQAGWNTIDLSSIVGTPGKFFHIDGTDSDNIYAYGIAFYDHTFVHYDGLTWSVIPAVSPINVSPMRDIAAAPNGLYALHGYNSKVSFYDGNTWVEISDETAFPTAPQDCNGQGRSTGYWIVFGGLWWNPHTNALYVAGGSNGWTRCIWRYQNGTWTSLLEENGSAFDYITGLADGSMFALEHSDDKLYAFTGSSWQQVGTFPSDAKMDLWGPNANSIYMPGEEKIYHSTDLGATWTSIPIPRPSWFSSGYVDYSSIWGTSDNDFYVGGEDGAIVHYNGSTWEDVSPPFNTYNDWIRDLWGYGNTVYAVGVNHPYILSRQTSATPTPTPTPTGQVATPTPTPTPVRNYRFWGDITSENGQPLADVLINLLAYNSEAAAWDQIGQTRSHGNGQFYLFRWEDKGYTRYRIVVQPPPEWVAIRAEAPYPAKIIDSYTIEYENIPSGYYKNNRFTLARPTPTPTPTPTPEIPTLTMSGGGDPQQMCPSKEEWSVQRVTIAVNEVSDWKVSRIGFSASGTGNEARDIKEARLYRGNQLLGTATYNQDNGAISFDVDITIPAGSSVSLELRYLLDLDKLEWDSEKNKGAKTYMTVTGINRLSATPLNGATEYKLLPPDPIQGPLQQVARVWNTSVSPWQGFGVIQAAIDADITQDGHTLQLCPATFVENVQVTKALTIKPMGDAAPAVHAKKADQSTFTIRSSGVTLEGLTISGATGNGAAGVLAVGKDFLNVLTGILLKGNAIEHNFYGVFFRHVDDSRLESNTIQRNTSYAIYISENHPDDEAFVAVGPDNRLTTADAGVVVDDAWHTQIFQNQFQGVASMTELNATRAAADLPDAQKALIYLRNVSYALVQNNTLNGGNHGIVVEKGNVGTVTDNRLEGNVIEFAREYGILLRGAKNTVLVDNKVRENTKGGIYLDATENTWVKQEKSKCLVSNWDTDAPQVALVSAVNGAKQTRIYRCKLEAHTKGTGVYMEASQGLSLRGSRVLGGAYGIYMKNASGLLLWDSVQVTGQAKTGLYCEDSTGIEVRNGTNVFQGQDEYAMAFFRCTAPSQGRNSIRYARFDGAGKARHAIYLEESADFFLGHSTFTGYVDAAIAITATQQVDVLNNTFTGGPVGVEVTASQDVRVERSTFKGQAETAVRAQNVSTLALKENTVTPATAQARARQAVAAGSGPDGFRLTEVQGGQVLTNTVQNLAGQGIVVEGGQNVTLGGNRLQNLGGRGVYLRQGQNHAVRGNTISQVQGGILAWQSNARVEGNTITDAKGYGIFLYEVEGATVAQNSVRNTRKGSSDPDTPYATESGNGHAFYQFWGYQNRVEDNQFWGSDGSGAFLECGSSAHSVGCALSSLVKNDVTDNNSFGIYLFFADHVHLQGNRVVNNRGAGIFLHGAQACIVDDASDDTHTVIQGHTHGVVIKEGVGNTVRDAVITRPAEHGIYLVDTQLNSLQYNTITEPGKDGIRVLRSPRNIHWNRIGSIGGNTITKPGQYGIYLSQSPENLLELNKIKEASQDGIFLHRSDKTVMKVNTVTNSARYGIHLQSTQQATVSKNSVEGSGDHALFLEGGANKNLIEENTLGGEEAPNQGDGIHLAYAHFNQVKGNTIQYNQGHGVYMSVTEGNVFQGNTFLENRGDGIRAEGSRKLLIRGNTFEDNYGNAIALVNSQVDNRAKRSLVRDNRAFINDYFDGGKNGIYIDNADYIDVWRNRVTGFPESGVFARHTDHTTIKWNTLLNNCSGITVEDSLFGVDSVAYNTVRNSWCIFTGIHITSSTADLVGNDIAQNTGDGVIVDSGSQVTLRRNALQNNGRDGVRVLSGAQATLRGNTLADNEGLAVNNLDPDVTVDARENWWGDASGPGGEGPGTGDEVSAGVEYSDWFNAPAGLAVSASPTTVLALPGSQTAGWVTLQTLDSVPLTVTVRAGDGAGWVPVGFMQTVVLTDTAGVALPVTVTVPADAAAGTANPVTVTAEGDGVMVRTTFTVTVLQPVRGVSILGPSVVNPGQVVTYTAVVTPTDVAEVTYLWWPEPQNGQGTSTVTLAWDTPGVYTVAVDVEQLDAVIRADWTVVVRGDRRMYLPLTMR